MVVAKRQETTTVVYGPPTKHRHPLNDHILSGRCVHTKYHPWIPYQFHLASHVLTRTPPTHEWTSQDVIFTLLILFTVWPFSLSHSQRYILGVVGYIFNLMRFSAYILCT